VILIFAVFPFLWTLAIALTDKTAGTSIYAFPQSLLPHQVTLHNFVDVYRTFHLGAYLWNSVSITAMTVLGTLVVSALAAYPLARFRFPGRQLIFGAIVATLVLPSETNFIVNTLTLKSLHLLGTHLGVVIPTVAGAFGIFLMRQYIGSAIPRELVEAARIDGCSEFTIYRRIIVPLCGPAMATLGLVTFIASWNNFLGPLIIFRSAQTFTAPLALRSLQGLVNTDWGALMLGVGLTVLPLLVVFALASRQLIAGLTAGATKG